MNKDIKISHTWKTKKPYSNEWQTAPKFLLRMTGFEVELIEGLQFTSTASEIREKLSVDPPRGKNYQTLFDETQTVFAKELEEKTGYLYRISSGEKFREALFLSNPSNYYLIERWIDGKTQRPSKIRQGLLSVITYLQRFCMKNDTASFFGPSFWGTFDLNTGNNLIFSYKELPKVRRSIFFSHWCAAAVARWIQTQPGAEHIIRPRRVPTMSLLKNRVYGVEPAAEQWKKVDKLLQLAPHALDIFQLIDGTRSLSDLFREAGERFALSKESTRTIVHHFVSKGLVTADIEIPVGLLQPMDYLEGLIKKTTQDAAKTVVSRFQDFKREFVSADLKERKKLFANMCDYFKQTTQMNPTRGKGAHYADRTFFYEDGTRNFDKFIVGGKILEEINSLGPIWDLLCIPDEHEYQLLQETMVRKFRQWFPHRTTVPFVEYVNAFLDDSVSLYEHFDIIFKEVQKLSQHIFHRLVLPGEWKETVVRRTMQEILSINRQYKKTVTPGAIISPDIMIAASGKDDINAGNYQLVIGEVHASVDAITHCPLVFFLSNRDKEMLRSFVTDKYAESVNKDEWAVDLVRIHMRKTSGQLTLKGIDIEGIGRSPKMREDVVMLADLEVCLHQDKLRLYSPKWEKYIRLTSMRLPNNSPKETNPLRPFSLPEREGGLKPPRDMSYCPRINVGNTILVRRTWKINYRDWPYKLQPTHSYWDFNLFVHMIKIKEHYNLPNHVFTRIENEPKPIFVDFENYFLLHAFYRKWQLHQKSVTFTEAFPSIENAWLKDENGHYLCELRTGCYRKAGGTCSTPPDSMTKKKEK